MLLPSIVIASLLFLPSIVIAQVLLLPSNDITPLLLLPTVIPPSPTPAQMSSSPPPTSLPGAPAPTEPFPPRLSRLYQRAGEQSGSRRTNMCTQSITYGRSLLTYSVVLNKRPLKFLKCVDSNTNATARYRCAVAAHSTSFTFYFSLHCLFCHDQVGSGKFMAFFNL